MICASIKSISTRIATTLMLLRWKEINPLIFCVWNKLLMNLLTPHQYQTRSATQVHTIWQLVVMYLDKIDAGEVLIQAKTWPSPCCVQLILNSFLKEVTVGPAWRKLMGATLNLCAVRRCVDQYCSMTGSGSKTCSNQREEERFHH